MSKTDDLKGYLPTYYSESKEMNAKCDTTGNELDNVIYDTEDLLSQCFPQKATWGIKFWEEFLGLPINDTEDIKIRRAKVILKLSRTSPMTPNEFKKLLRNFAEDAEVSSTNEPYKILVTLVNKHSFNLDIRTVLNEIENIKPCHIDYNLAFKYIDSSGVQVDTSNLLYNLPIIGGYCGVIPIPVLKAWTIPQLNIGVTETIMKIIKDFKFCGTLNCGGGAFI